MERLRNAGPGCRARSRSSRLTSTARPTPTSCACRCPAPGVALYLKDESTHPVRQPQAPAGALAVPLWAVQRLDRAATPPSSRRQAAPPRSRRPTSPACSACASSPSCRARPRPRRSPQIAFYGGESHFVDRPAEMYAESARLAAALGGHYMDQFTYAERATDWRGNNNIAESIFGQMAHEEHPVPAWIVVGAGTGGTSATLGRYIRYRRLPTASASPTPRRRCSTATSPTARIRTASGPPSVIEGIGRLRCEPSFIPDLIDRACAVPDAASIAAARVLSRRIGRSCGGSTGTNMWAVARLVTEMAARGEDGSVVDAPLRPRRALPQHPARPRLAPPPHLDGQREGDRHGAFLRDRRARASDPPTPLARSIPTSFPMHRRCAWVVHAGASRKSLLARHGNSGYRAKAAAAAASIASTATNWCQSRRRASASTSAGPPMPAPPHRQRQPQLRIERSPPAETSAETPPAPARSRCQKPMAEAPPARSRPGRERHPETVVDAADPRRGEPAPARPPAPPPPAAAGRGAACRAAPRACGSRPASRPPRAAPSTRCS